MVEALEDSSTKPFQGRVKESLLLRTHWSIATVGRWVTSDKHSAQSVNACRKQTPFETGS